MELIQHRGESLEGLSGNVVSLLYIPTIAVFLKLVTHSVLIARKRLK